MKQLTGIAVSPGVAMGGALVMDFEGFRIPQRSVARDAVEDELRRLDRAVESAAAEIASHRDEVTAELGGQCGAIFAAHLQMLRDPRLREQIETLIGQRHVSPEHAVRTALQGYVKLFQHLDNAALAERANDVFDVEWLLLRHLLGQGRQEMTRLTSPALVVAYNLTPSQTARLDRRHVRGIITEAGGPGSHTAIVAKAMNIPAVVGTGPFLTDVCGGDTIIVDGNHGRVIVQPDRETIQQYRRDQAGRPSQPTGSGETPDILPVTE